MPSVDFKLPRATAEGEVERMLDSAAIKVESKQPLNNGTGTKFICSSALSFILYFKREFSSKIVVEKGELPPVFGVLNSGEHKGERTKNVFRREIKEIPNFDKHIGTDESGKGDYFGPLVVAGVFVTANDEQILKLLGIRDSKLGSDAKNMELARKIFEVLGGDKISVISIGPMRYNSLYTQMGSNLNSILGWGHARVIENLLKNNECGHVVVDQFGGEDVIKKALFKGGRGVEVLQTPKAERDIAVAAASILARAKFLNELKKLGSDLDIELPKGAGGAVTETAKKIVFLKGKDYLKTVAKLHFKNSDVL